MKVLKSLIDLFYPKTCVHCDVYLLQEETILCTKCRFDLPLFTAKSEQNNLITKTFEGKMNVEAAYSLLYFRKHGITKSLIHDLKYKGNQEVGEFLAYLTYDQIKNFKVFSTVDYIVPVPLHRKKLRKRGYNQLTYFGETLSNLLSVQYKTSVLKRGLATKTQTLKSRFDRFLTSKEKFYISNTDTFKNKHVLLIDDVITTGATLESCMQELCKTSGIKISILTMAYTE